MGLGVTVLDSVGLCESTQRASYNTPLCLACSAHYGLILPHIQPSLPSLPRYHQICSGAQETGSSGLCIFLFQAELALFREKGRLVTPRSNLPFLPWHTQLYPSMHEHDPPVLSAVNHMQCTCRHMHTAHVPATCASCCCSGQINTHMLLNRVII